jgi:hypothetical protein
MWDPTSHPDYRTESLNSDSHQCNNLVPAEACLFADLTSQDNDAVDQIAGSPS